MWTGKNPWGGWESPLRWLGAYPKEHYDSVEIICDQLPLCGPCPILGTWEVDKNRPVPHFKLSSPNGGISHSWRKRQSLALQSKFRPYSNSKELDTAGDFHDT